jgi:hypothetical protein
MSAPRRRGLDSIRDLIASPGTVTAATLDKNVAALQDRGHVLLVEPGAAEVHRKAGTWCDDPKIYA